MSEETDAHIRKLQDLIDIQESPGNWDYDKYMLGLLNGMIIAMSILDGKDPEFRDHPKTWASDLEALDKFNTSGAVINEDNIISSTNKE